jgi:hypothetical protein
MELQHAGLCLLMLLRCNGAIRRLVTLCHADPPLHTAIVLQRHIVIIAVYSCLTLTGAARSTTSPSADSMAVMLDWSPEKRTCKGSNSIHTSASSTASRFRQSDSCCA